MRDQIVLARTPANPFSPPDIFAATLATIQTNSYLRRVSWIFDCAILLLAAVVLGKLCHISRVNLVLGAIAFSAAYCLIALGDLTLAHLAARLSAAGRGLVTRFDFNRDPTPLSRETAERDHNTFAHPVIRSVGDL